MSFSVSSKGEVSYTIFPNNSFPSTFLVMTKPSHPNHLAFRGQFYEVVLYFFFLWQSYTLYTLNLILTESQNVYQFSFRHLLSIALALVSYLVSSCSVHFQGGSCVLPTGRYLEDPSPYSQTFSKLVLADPHCFSFFVQILPYRLKLLMLFITPVSWQLLVLFASNFEVPLTTFWA